MDWTIDVVGVSESVELSVEQRNWGGNCLCLIRDQALQCGLWEFIGTFSSIVVFVRDVVQQLLGALGNKVVARANGTYFG